MGGVFCMELPKNITQIGEADKHCRVYVEDYVVSYIKQMNGMAQNKDIAIALYGRRTTENGVAYLFAYGSAKLNFLQTRYGTCPRHRSRRSRSCGKSIFRK